jgi:hypothetical protein
MFKCNKGLAYLVFIVALSVTSPSSSHEHKHSPVEQLARNFIVAFNTGDYDAMASFYQHAASIPESIAEFRFKLVGNPSRIDGFSAGINPEDNVDRSGADIGSGTDHAVPGHDSEYGPFGFLVSENGVYQTQALLQSDGPHSTTTSCSPSAPTTARDSMRR